MKVEFDDIVQATTETMLKGLHNQRKEKHEEAEKMYEEAISKLKEEITVNENAKQRQQLMEYVKR